MEEIITELDLNFFCKDGVLFVKENLKSVYKTDYKEHVDGWLNEGKVSDDLLKLYVEHHILNVYDPDIDSIELFSYEDRRIIGTYTSKPDYDGYAEDLINVIVKPIE